MPIFRDKAGKAVCPMCNAHIDESNPRTFKDRLSAREFKISGLCQKCQDEVFHSADEDA
jgi:uncharacterized Zn finger protein (UPF0148 family)